MKWLVLIGLVFWLLACESRVVDKVSAPPTGLAEGAIPFEGLALAVQPAFPTVQTAADLNKYNAVISIKGGTAHPITVERQIESQGAKAWAIIGTLGPSTPLLNDLLVPVGTTLTYRVSQNHLTQGRLSKELTTTVPNDFGCDKHEALSQRFTELEVNRFFMSENCELVTMGDYLHVRAAEFTARPGAKFITQHPGDETETRKVDPREKAGEVMIIADRATGTLVIEPLFKSDISQYPTQPFLLQQQILFPGKSGSQAFTFRFLFRSDLIISAPSAIEDDHGFSVARPIIQDVAGKSLVMCANGFVPLEDFNGVYMISEIPGQLPNPNFLYVNGTTGAWQNYYFEEGKLDMRADRSRGALFSFNCKKRGEIEGYKKRFRIHPIENVAILNRIESAGGALSTVASMVRYDWSLRTLNETLRPRGKSAELGMAVLMWDQMEAAESLGTLLSLLSDKRATVLRYLELNKLDGIVFRMQVSKEAAGALAIENHKLHIPFDCGMTPEVLLQKMSDNSLQVPRR